MAGTDEGFGMKVARRRVAHLDRLAGRFINNVTVQIKDVEVCFSSKALGVATSLKLPPLGARSCMYMYTV